MALFRSLIRIFSGQTAINGLGCPISSHASVESDPATNDFQSNPSGVNPLRAIEHTNDYIIQNHEDLAMFATVFFGVLDPATGALSYINGGHDPLFILDPANGIRKRLGPTGPAVGVQPGADLETRRVQINTGEILFGYTDGVTEAQAKDGSFFNEERLMALLESGENSAPGLLDKISSSVKDHIDSAEQFDDITMLAVRRLPVDPKIS